MYKNLNRPILTTLHKQQFRKNQISNKQTKTDTLNLIGEEVGNNFELMVQKRLIEQKTVNTGTKTIKEGDLIELKSFAPTKETILRRKWQPT